MIKDDLGDDLGAVWECYYARDDPEQRGKRFSGAEVSKYLQVQGLD